MHKHGSVVILRPFSTAKTGHFESLKIIHPCSFDTNNVSDAVAPPQETLVGSSWTETKTKIALASLLYGHN